MLRIITALILLSAVVACSVYPRVDEAFGKSQAQMIATQTYDPEAAAHPPALAPALSDGQLQENVLMQLRKDISEGSKQVSQPTQFEVGSTSGGQ